MDKMSIVRTILLFLTLGNQVLTLTGHSPLPFDNEALAESVATVLVTTVSIWTWWKNNYISAKGLKQKEVLKENGLTK
jgi:SPP1 family holin